MKKVDVKLLSVYKDGGTHAYHDSDGNLYFEDKRIGTKTKGTIYDNHPNKKDAKILNVELNVIE